MKDITKKYTNSELTVVWKPNMCIHSEKCFKGLPNVFDPKRKPWIDAEAASTNKIKSQVNQCPSGALSYFMNNEHQKEDENVTVESIVEITENGPLMVYGNLVVKRHNGETDRKNKVTAFCRCGASNNKPYCDGTHAKISFEG